MKNLARLLPACLLGSLLMAVLLTGCGVTSTSLSSGNAPATGAPARAPTATVTGGSRTSLPQLACQLQISVRPIDVMDATLHCTISQLAVSETSFVLHYSAESNPVQPEIRTHLCQGSLSGGSGSCTAILSSVLSLPLTRGAVTGFTLPHHYPLGPVVPKQVPSGTPTGTPLPFQPRG